MRRARPAAVYLKGKDAIIGKLGEFFVHHRRAVDANRDLLADATDAVVVEPRFEDLVALRLRRHFHGAGQVGAEPSPQIPQLVHLRSGDHGHLAEHDLLAAEKHARYAVAVLEMGLEGELKVLEV